MKAHRIVIAAALALGILTGCKKEASVQATSSATPAPAPAPRNVMEIELTPALEKLVRVAPPPTQSIANSFVVAARVEADRRRIANIHSPVAGRITQMHAFAGDHVKKGQVLATLYGTGLTDIELSLLKALSQQQLAQRAVERANQLLAAGVIGSAEVQRRQAEVQQSTAEITVLRDQLKILGMSEAAIAQMEATRTVNSVTDIVAEIDGTVMERKASVGQIVQPSDTIYEVADLTSVWVIADVPEQQAGHIAVGHDVEIEISAFQGNRIRGKVSYVSPTVNPETRTVEVRLDLPNPKLRYKPAMLAEMNLREAAQQQRVVPSTAIVREDNREYLFVQKNSKVFELREVTLGEEFETQRVLLSGVQNGEKIVLDGAFHVNNERRRLALSTGN